MVKFILSLRESSLQSLRLDSVSLTASVSPNAQPAPLTQAGVVQNPQNAQNVAGPAGANLLAGMNALAPLGIAQNGLNAPNVQAQLPAPIPPNIQQPPGNDWLNPPRPGSWAEIIDRLTPGITLTDIRYSRDNTGLEPPVKEPTAFSKLALESCGYVRIPLDFDQTLIDPPHGHHPLNTHITKRITDIDPFMMKSHDSNLGVVVNHIGTTESATLQHAWNMVTDWGASRLELLADSRADGVANAGRGRISGLVEATHPSSNPPHD